MTMMAEKEGRQQQKRGISGPGGLSYLKWLCMILILIYIKILRPFALKKNLSPSLNCVHYICKDCSV